MGSDSCSFRSRWKGQYLHCGSKIHLRKAGENFKKEEYKQQCTQNKMMLGNIQYVLHYWVICRDFTQSSTAPALFLYAQRSFSCLKNSCPSFPSQPLLWAPASVHFPVSLAHPLVPWIHFVLLPCSACHEFELFICWVLSTYKIFSLYIWTYKRKPTNKTRAFFFPNLPS